jgi:hypothetical protein
MLQVLSSNISEAGSWGVNKLINFAYRFLEFHAMG